MAGECLRVLLGHTGGLNDFRGSEVDGESLAVSVFGWDILPFFRLFQLVQKCAESIILYDIVSCIGHIFSMLLLDPFPFRSDHVWSPSLRMACPSQHWAVPTEPFPLRMGQSSLAGGSVIPWEVNKCGPALWRRGKGRWGARRKRKWVGTELQAVETGNCHCLIYHLGLIDSNLQLIQIVIDHFGESFDSNLQL